MAAEIVHGIARTLWLAPVVGDFRARQIAVFSGSLLILLIVSVTIRLAPEARSWELAGTISGTAPAAVDPASLIV
jgi:hypothetical protein